MLTCMEELRLQARKLRISMIEMLVEAKSGHPGGSLSCTEIVTALYFSEMRHDPKNPKKEDRDRFVISKGHGVPAVYAAMAHAGYFSTSELMTLRKTGARLQGHPDHVRLPGIEASTGSLGQGLSVALGMALASRLASKPWHTYCLLGDGECQEGQVWEAAMAAPKFKLGGSLTAILDYNKGQIDGHVDEVMPIEPIADKWRAFNWDVSVIDGHRFEEIIPALRASRGAKGRPHMIIANTVKGKGVSFMEHNASWHGAAPNKEQAGKALAEIKAGLV
ncbi:MAG: transketolase [Deltaproteobacteria bacterium]|nr:transketolase [Deltaproteobacteria bacterium]